MSLFVQPMHLSVAIVLEFRLTMIHAYSSDKNIPTPNAMKNDTEAIPIPSSMINSTEKLVQKIKIVYIRQNTVNCLFSRKTITTAFLNNLNAN